jgi:polynucleotide 5'-hydroxyl-kinase GRC3/NOL9
MKETGGNTEIIPEPEWEYLLGELIRYKGIALIMGKTNSGKSAIARYLVERLVSEGIAVSLVDCDIGQSSLGLPGAVSMKVFRDKRDCKRFSFERMSFLGTANPAMVIPVMIETSGRMVDLCRKTSEITLVDTTGLVSGRLGQTLKIGKVMRIRPDHIIAVCRGQELEHILEPAKEVHIYRIRTAKNVKTRSTAARIRYRGGRLQDYFKRAPLFSFVVDENIARFYYRARPIRPEDHVPEGTIIGLNRYKDTFGLGIVLLHSAGSVAFRSPLKSIKRINRVIFGDITMQASGVSQQHGAGYRQDLRGG